MMNEKTWVERRRHARVSVRAAVIVRSAGHAVHGTAVSVSATTLEVGCQLGASLLAMAGADVEITMRLNGATGGWFALSGRVRRVRAASHSVVIALASVPPPLATWIAEQTDRTEVSAIEVMVVDRDSGRRIQIAAAFRAEGCHVIEAGTPLEALDELERASFTTDVIAVADTDPDRIGIDLRDHLDDAGNALVISIGDPEWTPTRARLASSDAEGPLQERVRLFLLARAAAGARGGVNVP